MQIKSTTYYPPQTKIAAIKENQKITNIVDNVKKQEPCYTLLLGMLNCAVIMENNMMGTEKITSRIMI